MGKNLQRNCGYAKFRKRRRTHQKHVAETKVLYSLDFALILQVYGVLYKKERDLAKLTKQATILKA